MPTDRLPMSRHDPPPMRPLSSQRRICVLSENLRTGMFVAELDRPWSDTPFLIQGFAIDSAIELETLRKYCRHVFVDLESSTPESSDLLRAIGPADRQIGGFEDTMPHSSTMQPSATEDRREEDPKSDAAQAQAQAGFMPENPAQDPAAARAPDAPPASAADHAPAKRPPPARTFRARADVSITRDTRRRFRALVSDTLPGPGCDDELPMASRALQRLKTIFTASPSGVGHDARSLAALRTELGRLLAPDERLRERAARYSVDDELPRAGQSLAQAEAALGGLLEALRAGRSASLERIVVAANHMADSISDNPDAQMRVAQQRHEPLQANHQGARVGLYMATLARQLGLPRRLMAQAAMVGILADVGKARLPRALLEKPGMLNASEYGLIKEHVRLGMDLLAGIGQLPPLVADGIAQHHERLDGSGYPAGLRRRDIGIFGRMAAIADSYAALTMPRAYAEPLAPQEALMNLFQWSGSSFDATLVEQFVQAIGVFPAGSLVELASGELALVCERNPGHPLQPRVRLLTWPDRRLLAVGIDVDLLHPRKSLEAGLTPGRVVRGLQPGAFGIMPMAPTASAPDSP